MGMVTVTLTGTNLVVDGVIMPIGSQCDVTAAEAKALIDRGLAESLDSKLIETSEPVQGDAVIDQDQRIAIIADAIRDLLESDPEKELDDVWTKAGKPEVSALSELVGWGVSASERDAALAEIDKK